MPPAPRMARLLDDSSATQDILSRGSGGVGDALRRMSFIDSPRASRGNCDCASSSGNAEGDGRSARSAANDAARNNRVGAAHGTADGSSDSMRDGVADDTRDSAHDGMLGVDACTRADACVWADTCRDMQRDCEGLGIELLTPNMRRTQSMPPSGTGTSAGRPSQCRSATACSSASANSLLPTEHSTPRADSCCRSSDSLIRCSGGRTTSG
mmetsp:Transcript_44180/g.132402  ORF Transcript_44180/g.132402 Transcript_44180/m.132402 type:complete len:211 (+) Transcript_44180:2293-2925(+)